MSKSNIRKRHSSSRDNNVSNKKQKTSLVITNALVREIINLKDVKKLQQVINQIDNIDQRFDNNQTLLMICAETGFLDGSRILLVNCANITLVNNQNETALLSAIDRGYTDIAIEFLQHKDSANAINKADIHGITPLYAATCSQNEQIVKQLMLHENLNANQNAHGINLTFEIFNGSGVIMDYYSPLLMAAFSGNEVIFKLLMSHKNILVNPLTERDISPLLVATHRGNAVMVKLLLEHHNIDVNQETHYSTLAHMVDEIAPIKTLFPLIAAIEYGHKAIVELLLEHQNINSNNTDHNGRTPLYVATAHGDISIIKLLLDHGAKIKINTTNNISCLHAAVVSDNPKLIKIIYNEYTKQNGYAPILKRIIEDSNHIPDNTKSGYLALIPKILTFWNNTDLKSNSHATPLHVAAQCGKLNAIKTLIELGANIEAKDSVGDTPLHWAVYYGEFNNIKTLIELGANIEAKNNQDKTPLDIARDKLAKEYFMYNPAIAVYLKYISDARQEKEQLAKIELESNNCDLDIEHSAQQILGNNPEFSDAELL